MHTLTHAFRDFPLMNLFDTETTGPDPQTDAIVQLGVAPYEGEDLRSQPHVWLIDPERPIPQEATKIHGIMDHMVKGKPTFAQAAATFFNILTCGGRPETVVVAGYNGLRFDGPLVKRQFAECGIAWEPLIFDPYPFVSWFHRERAAKQGRKLTPIASFYGYDLQGAHDAGRDALAAAHILFEMRGRGLIPDTYEVAQQVMHRINDTVESEVAAWRYYLYAHRETGELMMGFGQSCGKPLNETRPDYFSWMFANGNLDEAPEQVKEWFKRRAKRETIDASKNELVQKVRETSAWLKEQKARSEAAASTAGEVRPNMRIRAAQPPDIGGPAAAVQERELFAAPIMLKPVPVVPGGIVPDDVAAKLPVLKPLPTPPAKLAPGVIVPERADAPRLDPTIPSEFKATTDKADLPDTTKWMETKGLPLIGGKRWIFERNAMGFGAIVVWLRPEFQESDSRQLQELAQQLHKAVNAELPAMDSHEWVAMATATLGQGDIKAVPTIRVTVRLDGIQLSASVGGPPTIGEGTQITPGMLKGDAPMLGTLVPTK